MVLRGFDYGGRLSRLPVTERSCGNCDLHVALVTLMSRHGCSCAGRRPAILQSSPTAVRVTLRKPRLWSGNTRGDGNADTEGPPDAITACDERLSPCSRRDTILAGTEWAPARLAGQRESTRPASHTV
jgi:hypothetical protein